jgi:hypothetical protein
MSLEEMTARLSLLHSTSVEYFIEQLTLAVLFSSLLFTPSNVTAPAQPSPLAVVYEAASY